MLLVYAGIAAVTVGIVFAGVLPWALRHEGSGGVALVLAILGTLLAPGFWTGVPPGLAAGGACSAGVSATKGRRLSQAAFVIGVLGVLFNLESHAEAVPTGHALRPAPPTRSDALDPSWGSAAWRRLARLLLGVASLGTCQDRCWCGHAPRRLSPRCP